MHLRLGQHTCHSSTNLVPILQQTHLKSQFFSQILKNILLCDSLGDFLSLGVHVGLVAHGLGDVSGLGASLGQLVLNHDDLGNVLRGCAASRDGFLGKNNLRKTLKN